MDTSPEYILMCKKAEDVQETWNPQVGDFYEHSQGGQRIIVVKDATQRRLANEYRRRWNPKWKRVTWLPRQDQLQDMLNITGKDRKPLHALFFKFRGFVQCGDEDTWWGFMDEFNSMEQLWLAFVMKEKYNKIWNGEDWKEEP